MARIWQWYLHQLRTRTLATQMITGGTLSTFADTIAQRAVERRDTQDWARSARQAVYSTFIFAPIANRWFFLLSKIKLHSLVATAITRTAIDISFFSPSATSLFLLCVGTMEGKTLQQIRDKWKRMFLPVWKNQCLLFGPVGLINMVWVPLHARPPVINVVSVIWMVYLANANAQGDVEDGKVTAALEAA